MKILVTGSKGFLGRNLVENLKNIKYGKSKKYPQTDIEIFEYDIDTPQEMLSVWAKEADFVYHLAGVNRPKDKSEFYSGNTDLTKTLLDLLSQAKKSPIMLSSTIWASGDTDYGKSKRAAEDAVLEYAKNTGAKSYVYRFTNLFGKWTRPGYNSVVATFCYNVANDLPITINDENAQVTLNYVDDVVYELIDALFGNEHREGNYCYVPTSHTVTLGKLAEIIRSFKDKNRTAFMPDCKDEFTKKLYAMYLTYVPQQDLAFASVTNSDVRGSFTELYKCNFGEQVSLNVVKPNQLKGNHWHNTKIERFTIISGQGVIRLRKLGTTEVLEYKNQVGEVLNVDIPAGYTHNMENLGQEDMLVIIWCNEPFNPNNPDTFFEEV